MLGHPAFVAGLDRSDAQRVTLLAEQGVAAIAGAVRPDLARFGEVRDVFCLAAGPRHVGSGWRWKRVADGVSAADKILTLSKGVEHFATNTGHYVHVGDRISAVGDHDTDTGNGTAHRPH